MRLIDQLAALQATDTDLDADRKRYAEIQAALNPPASLQQAQAERDKVAARLQHWRKERRERETAVADQNAKIQSQENRLFGSKVRDPREQVALQQNIDALKRHLDTLEEAELEAILEVEQGESDLMKAEATYAREQAAWAEEESRLQQERQALIIHARQLKARREAAVNGIDPVMLNRYEALRRNSGGVAVATVQGANCGGCGAALPTAVRQQSHGEDIVTCPICRRMLAG